MRPFISTDVLSVHNHETKPQAGLHPLGVLGFPSTPLRNTPGLHWHSKMAWVATASKPATFAEVAAGKKKPSEEQKECYLLTRIPRGRYNDHVTSNLYHELTAFQKFETKSSVRCLCVPPASSLDTPTPMCPTTTEAVPCIVVPTVTTGMTTVREST